MQYIERASDPRARVHYSFRPQFPLPRLARRREKTVREADIALATGPFSSFATCRRVLTLLDVENLTYSALNLGMVLDFGMLAELVKASLPDPALHAVFSTPKGDDGIARLLAGMGWTPHEREIVYKRGRQNDHKPANADVALAFHAAALIGATGADACIIATGDGCLALDIARAIQATFRTCSVIATMSLAGSTSPLIDARRTSSVNLNIEIGRDAMQAADERAQSPLTLFDAISDCHRITGGGTHAHR